MRDFMRTPLLALLGVCFIATGLLAQSGLDDLSDTHRAMAEQLGETAVEWWNPRLNKYRRAIDQVLSEEDRAALDQMRIRFAILIEKVGPKIGSEFTDEDNGREVNLEVEDDNGDAGMELMEIWMQTVEIAIRYKEDLAPLQKKVFTDVVGFSGELAMTMESWSEKNRAALSADEKGASFLSNREEITMTLKKVEGMEEEFSSIYGFIVEPLVMLFNGGDLRDMFPGVVGESATAGADNLFDLLPASGVLMQNYPNPADQMTTIPLNLKRSGNASLRVYSESGDLVKSLDLGTLPAGEGKVELETADLANGTYLYQVVLDGSDGEELYAKVMQVVR